MHTKIRGIRSSLERFSWNTKDRDIWVVRTKIRKWFSMLENKYVISSLTSVETWSQELLIINSVNDFIFSL